MKTQRSLSMKSGTEKGMLPPLLEIPSLEELTARGKSSRTSWTHVKLWLKEQLGKATRPLIDAGCNARRSNLQPLLSVLGSPLGPCPVEVQPFCQISMKENPISASSAQYIVHQYMAATGANSSKKHSNFYAMGEVNMVASEFDSSSNNSCNGVSRRVNPSRVSEGGCFLMWQMMPDVWCVELSLAGCKVRVGSNGSLVWRHTPWMGSHRVKGPVRPLRRALQGLDPWTIGNMFMHTRCIGEKTIDGLECFILKLVASPEVFQDRSDGPAEIIRHVMFGYFSQKTGLLVHLEDTHILRIQSQVGLAVETVYWETSTETSLKGYREVEGVYIPHEGKTVSTLFRLGEVPMSHTRTRLEESWMIEEVAFSVPGVSAESFIPPSDVGESATLSEAYELASDEATVGGALAYVGSHAGGSKVAALDVVSSQNRVFNVIASNSLSPN